MGIRNVEVLTMNEEPVQPEDCDNPDEFSNQKVKDADFEAEETNKKEAK